MAPSIQYQCASCRLVYDAAEELYAHIGQRHTVLLREVGPERGDFVVFAPTQSDVERARIVQPLDVSFVAISVPQWVQQASLRLANIEGIEEEE